MIDEDLDEILSVLENPIRRHILYKLTQETHYPLQLSKELNVSQQAIMKHLRVLEEYHMVESFEEKSTLGGPPRKCYVPTRRFTIRIDMGPNIFNSELRQLEDTEKHLKEDKKPDDPQKLGEKYNTATKTKDANKRLVEYLNILKELNNELQNIEDKRAFLVKARETILKDAYSTIGNLVDDYVSRQILYYILDKNDLSLTSISGALGLREKVIEDIFIQFKKQRILLDLEDDLHE